MSRITFWGDFKADNVNHLNLSGELMLLLNNSELNVVNFEAPVCSPSSMRIRKSGPNIFQDVDAPEWLELRGFNAISLANNHMMDYGNKGLEVTQALFKTSSTMGVGLWNEAYKPHVFTLKNGATVGIINCTHKEFGVLSDKWTDRNNKGCAWTLSPEIERECKDLLTGGVSSLVVYTHGGVEFMDIPLPEWRDTYRRFIDWGADAVIASHPHVPQGIEMYKGKPICYSLGNFCFQKEGKLQNHWNESLCCVMDISERGECQIKVIPIQYD